MRLYKSFLVLLVSFLLSACVASSTNVKGDKALAPTEGVVVTRLVSNWKGYNNPLLAKVEFFFFGKSTSGLNKNSLSLDRANDLKVVSLPAGSYLWSHLGFGNRHLQMSGGFEVKPGTITYIGDINSQLSLGAFSAGAKINVENKASDIKKILQKEYPELLSKYPLVTDITDLKP